jgi:glucose/arabinose dehydrogenase
VAAALFALVVPAQSEAAGRLVAQAMQPVQATAPRGDGRLFVLERRGLVRVLRGGRLRSRPFLDIRGLVRLPFPNDQYRDQSGAFSLAFAPDYRRSGRLYVLYTGRDRRIHVDEFRRAHGSPEHASARSRRAVLSLRQEGLNDLGGDLVFGPDGHLWVSLGEGNHAERSQDLGRLNGKLLRIDPRPADGRPYTIPPGNPFAMRPGARPEIFAFGLRSPWRFTFWQRELILADVGEQRFEEVNLLDLDRSAGANLGWPIFEGPKRLQPGDGPFLAPALSREHGRNMCAIVGGHVVGGRYLYGDVCSGALRSVRIGKTGMRADHGLGMRVPYLVSFGRDGHGREYALSLNGGIYRTGR